MTPSPPPARHAADAQAKSPKPYPVCGAKRHQGEPGATCQNAAGWGTDHPGSGACKLHGGATPNAGKAARKAEALATLAALGRPVEVDPGQALLSMVWEAAGNVEFLRSVVAELGENLTDVEASGAGGSRTVVAPMVTLYNAERDRLAAIAAATLKAGVEARHVELAQADARRLFGAVTAALAAAGIALEAQEAFRVAFASELRSLGAVPAVGPG